MNSKPFTILSAASILLVTFSISYYFLIYLPTSRNEKVSESVLETQDRSEKECAKAGRDYVDELQKEVDVKKENFIKEFKTYRLEADSLYGNYKILRTHYNPSLRSCFVSYNYKDGGKAFANVIYDLYKNQQVFQWGGGNYNDGDKFESKSKEIFEY